MYKIDLGSDSVTFEQREDGWHYSFESGNANGPYHNPMITFTAAQIHAMRLSDEVWNALCDAEDLFVEEFS